MVAPGIADDPVPENTTGTMSAVIFWKPVEFASQYNITIEAIGWNYMQQKRQVMTPTNTLEQCLDAAGVNPVLSYLLSGNSLALNNSIG